MALTIVATWGGDSSNAYCTLDYANSYITEQKVDNDAWVAAGEVTRKAAIVEATRHIDYSGRWVANKYYWNQALEFPRVLDETFTDTRYPGTGNVLLGTPGNIEYAEMEEDVKKACAEQANWIIKMSGKDDLQELQSRGVKNYSESIGRISESYTFKTSASVLCSDTKRLLRKYRSPTRLERG